MGNAKSSTESKQLKIPMRENVHLIWLNKNSFEHDQTLQHLVNHIHTSTDPDECFQLIKNLQQEKIYLIVSDSLAQKILPRVHHLTQIHSILIFGNKKTCAEKQYSKIQGVYTELTAVCNAIKKLAQNYERNSISISFMDTNDVNDRSKMNFDQIEPTFIYTKILKEIFLTIQFEDIHKKEFIQYCRELFSENFNELKTIKKFEKTYHQKTAISWYTYECFLYRMLNHALRTMNIEVMIKMGFYIRDLHNHIEKLYRKQVHSKTSLTLYRGQGMLKKDLENLKKKQGGLISFNSFLSTTKQRDIAFEFATDALKDSDMFGILFRLTIDPSQSTTIFASIDDLSCYEKSEDEILFSMNTIFRIGMIQSLSEHQRLYQIDLIMTTDHDTDLRKLTDRIREETFPNSIGWHRLGLLLIKIGQANQAQQIYEKLLEQSTKSAKIPLYEQLAWTKYHQGEYQEALKYYKKVLENKEKTRQSDHSDLAMTYNNIGLVYTDMGEYVKALVSYERALEIQEKSAQINQTDRAATYNNLGMIYSKIDEYFKAIEYYEKNLGINLEILPLNHPDLAKPYTNLALIYMKKGDFIQSISFHQKALDIRLQSLPSNHPDLAVSYHGLGNTYSQMNESTKALSYLEKALAIQQQTLSPNHPNLACSYHNIGSLYGQIGQHSKALIYLEKALIIRQQSLQSSHPDLALSYNNLGLTYENLHDYSKAYLFYQKALQIGEQSLPKDHSHLQQYQSNLSRIVHLFSRIQ